MAGSDPGDRAESRPAGWDDTEPTPRTPPRIARRPPGTGPVLPAVSDDERDVGWGRSPEPDDDERLLREVPPHHGS